MTDASLYFFIYTISIAFEFHMLIKMRKLCCLSIYLPCVIETYNSIIHFNNSLRLYKYNQGVLKTGDGEMRIQGPIAKAMVT